MSDIIKNIIKLYRPYLYFTLIFIIFSQKSFANNDSTIIQLNKKSEKYKTLNSQKSIALSLKAIKLADEGTNKSLRALSYKNLGIAFYFNNAYIEALKSYKIALKFYEELNDSAGISACYNNAATVYKDLNDLEQAIDLYLSALAIDKNLNDKQGLAIIYNNLGEIYHLQGKYIIALHFYLYSIKYEAELNNLNGMADCYLNMGAVMEENNLYKQSQLYYEKAINLYIKTSNYFRLGQCYNNLGLVFTRANNFYRAKDNFTTSLEIKEQTNDYYGKVTTFLNLGNLYILMNDTLKAKECFIKAIYWGNSEAFTLLQNNKKVDSLNFRHVDDYFFYWISYRIQEGNYLEIPQILFYKGYIHYNLGEYSSAIGYFVNSLETDEFQQLNSVKKDNYMYLSKSYEHLENFKKANYYAQKYINLSDSINASMISDFIQLKSNTKVDIKTDANYKTIIEKPKSCLKDFWFYSTLFLTILLLVILVLYIKKK